MSLLQDPDYIISHLRASYLQSFHDGIGERIIQPTHLYFSKAGPKRLTWASNTLVKLTEAGSPPIPTSTLNDKVALFRRERRTLTEDLGEIGSLAELRAMGRKQAAGGRRRASTLPTLLSPPSIMGSPSIRENVSDTIPHRNLNNGHPENVGFVDGIYDDLDDDGNITDDDTLSAVFEDNSESRLDSVDGSQHVSVDSDSELFASQFEEDDDEDDGLSGLSEEDDSDIEEELEIAALQLKLKPVPSSSSTTLDTSAASNITTGLDPTSRPRSNTASPRARKPRRTGKRQRSFDVGPGSKPVMRRMSGPARSQHSSQHSRRLTPDFNSSLVTIAATSIDVDVEDPQNKDHLEIQDGFASLLPSALDIGNLELPEILGFPAPATDSKSSTPKSYPSPDFPKWSQKRTAIAIPSSSSNLSSQIKAKQSSFDNPLEEYIQASGKSERKPLRLRMFMPLCEDPKNPWEVVVRTDVNVSNAIGFALYRYTEDNRLPKLSESMCNANHWNLRIVEDDGEPDEDFPALDRTRMISAYAFDEFALIEATEEQAAENEKITPRKRSQPTGSLAKSKDSSSTTSNTSSNATTIATSIPGVGNNVTVSVYQFPYNNMVSNVYWTDEISPNTLIQTILSRVCIANNLDKNLYCLKIAGTKVLAGGSMTLSSLPSSNNLELTPLRVVTSANGYVVPETNQPSELSSSVRRTEGSFNNPGGPSSISRAANLRFNSQNMKGDTTAPPVPETLNSMGYQKYMIWRRQPMSFISRHERVLAIDGEYVHIMPSDDRTWFDSPKTSSFHISQMIKCKQSRKVPNNFKIVIMKVSGSKRYDLEAVSATQAVEIVTKLRNLAVNYQHEGSVVA